MSDLYWIWSFLTALWTTTILNCAQPVNWDQCSRVNDWLVPWVRDVVDMQKNGAYSEERKLLREINGVAELDGGFSHSGRRTPDRKSNSRNQEQ